jgi:hypothetical protein
VSCMSTPCILQSGIQVLCRKVIRLATECLTQHQHPGAHHQGGEHQRAVQALHTHMACTCSCRWRLDKDESASIVTLMRSNLVDLMAPSPEALAQAAAAAGGRGGRDSGGSVAATAAPAADRRQRGVHARRWASDLHCVHHMHNFLRDMHVHLCLPPPHPSVSIRASQHDSYGGQHRIETLCYTAVPLRLRELVIDLAQPLQQRAPPPNHQVCWRGGHHSLHSASIRDVLHTIANVQTSRCQ